MHVPLFKLTPFIDLPQLSFGILLKLLAVSVNKRRSRHRRVTRCFHINLKQQSWPIPGHARPKRQVAICYRSQKLIDSSCKHGPRSQRWRRRADVTYWLWFERHRGVNGCFVVVRLSAAGVSGWSAPTRSRQSCSFGSLDLNSDQHERCRTS